MLIAEPRALRHHAELALQDQIQSDADRKAVDRRDQRLLETDIVRLAAAAPMEDRAVRVLMRRALPLRLITRKKLHVATGAEGLARSGKDAAIDVRIEADVAPARAQLD